MATTPIAGCWNLHGRAGDCSLSGQKQKARAHHHHAGDQASNHLVVGAITLGCRQQFIEADVDHHSSHTGEHNTHDQGCENGSQENVAEQSTKWLGKPGSEGEPEGLGAVTSGVMHWSRDCQALRNVVDGDRQGDAEPKPGVADGGHESCQTLGEVVNRDRQGREQAHA